jgi:hypothetical protein
VRAQVYAHAYFGKRLCGACEGVVVVVRVRVASARCFCEVCVINAHGACAWCICVSRASVFMWDSCAAVC